MPRLPPVTRKTFVLIRTTLRGHAGAGLPRMANPLPPEAGPPLQTVVNSVAATFSNANLNGNLPDSRARDHHARTPSPPAQASPLSEFPSSPAVLRPPTGRHPDRP